MAQRLFLLIVLLSSFCFSQEEIKIFQGVISDEINALTNVHIINQTARKATFSLSKGDFQIQARVGDTLKFTSIGYKTKYLVTSVQHFGIQTNQIHLEKEITVLDEVEIKKHNLTGILETDTKSVQQEKIINAETLRLPNAGNRILSPAERKLYTAQGGLKPAILPTSVSLDYMLNLLSGRIKKLKKGLEIEKIELDIRYLKNTFSNYIIKDLHIQQHNLHRFLYYCQEDINYKEEAKKGELKLIDFLRIKAEEFKQLKE